MPTFLSKPLSLLNPKPLTRAESLGDAGDVEEGGEDEAEHLLRMHPEHFVRGASEMGWIDLDLGSET